MKKIILGLGVIFSLGILANCARHQSHMDQTIGIIGPKELSKAPMHRDYKRENPAGAVAESRVK